jgi:hypothetical protein
LHAKFLDHFALKNFSSSLLSYFLHLIVSLKRSNMHGIIIDVSVKPNRKEDARKMLVDMIVPRAKTHKGIIKGYWLQELNGEILRAIQLYDTEVNARETANRIASEGPPPGAPVSLISVTTYEVLAEV